MTPLNANSARGDVAIQPQPLRELPPQGVVVNAACETAIEPRISPALVQHLERLCADLVQQAALRGAWSPAAGPEREPSSPEVSEAVAEDPTLSEVEAPAASDTSAAGSNAANTAEHPTGLPTAEFWDAVAAHHDAATASGMALNASVHDAVEQVAASYGARPAVNSGTEVHIRTEKTARAGTGPETQAVQRQSVDIIQAFESLFGLDVESPVDLAPSLTQTRPELQGRAARAVFMALTLQDGTQLAVNGRRG